MFVFVLVVCVDVMYEMLCTNNKCIKLNIIIILFN